MKYNKEACAAAGLYCSRASLILTSVTLASFTYSENNKRMTLVRTQIRTHLRLISQLKMKLCVQ